MAMNLLVCPRVTELPGREQGAPVVQGSARLARLLTRHGELYVICGDDHVRRKLGLMRLGNIMRLHSTPEEASSRIAEEASTPVQG